MIVGDCCLNRVGYIVYVDLDPTPGTFHRPLSALLSINEILDSQIHHYNPVAIFLTEQTERTNSGRRRIGFVIHVDLDPLPGTFHSKDSARNVISNILNERIPHYNPIVSVAPEQYQPDYIEEGNK